MNPYELLNRPYQCQCGKTHFVNTRKLVYETDALDRLVSFVGSMGQLDKSGSVVVVSDKRTNAIAGSKTASAIEGLQVEAEQIIVPDTESKTGWCVCDDATVEWLKKQILSIDSKPFLIIAAGSGVINDLCKWSSFDLGLPYIVFATAASMNGYSAANVAAKINGLKVVHRARGPLAVFAEPEIIENAPREMTSAGFGDTIAKPFSTADWQLNNFLFDEYYCPFCASIINDLEPGYLSNPELIAQCEGSAIKALFEALFFTGAAMTMVGTSAPASGAEHLFSHSLDMYSANRDMEHDLHGRQVGLGVIISAALYEKVLGIENPSFVSFEPDIDQDYWKNEKLIAAVEQQYSAKLPLAEKAGEILREAGKWDAFRELLSKSVTPAITVKNWLREANGADTVGDIGCSKELAIETINKMNQFRTRITIVDIAWLVGVLPGAAEQITNEYLF